MKRKALFLVASLAIFLSVQSIASDPKEINPVGTWAFAALTAPQGYGYGDIVVAKEKAGYTATLKYGEYAIKGTGVKYQKNVMTFTVNIEGEDVKIKATFSPDGVKGSATFSEGEIEFAAQKKR